MPADPAPDALSRVGEAVTVWLDDEAGRPTGAWLRGGWAGDRDEGASFAEQGGGAVSDLAADNVEHEGELEGERANATGGGAVDETRLPKGPSDWCGFAEALDGCEDRDVIARGEVRVGGDVGSRGLGVDVGSP